jgi:Bacterial SH3 domain
MNLPISRMLILISLFLFFSISLKAQTGWTLADVSGADSSIHLLDMETMKTKSLGIISGWHKVVYDNNSYTIALNDWNCTEKKSRLIQVTNYTQYGNVISSNSIPSPWKYIIPDSVEEGIFRMVCGKSNQNKPKTVEKNNANSSFAKIIVKKANLRSEPNANSEVIREVGLGEKLVLVTEDSVGVWYKVLDLKTNSQGWLHGNNFKIIKAKTSGGGFTKGKKN